MLEHKWIWNWYSKFLNKTIPNHFYVDEVIKEKCLAYYEIIVFEQSSQGVHSSPQGIYNVVRYLVIYWLQCLSCIFLVLIDRCMCESWRIPSWTASYHSLATIRDVWFWIKHSNGFDLFWITSLCLLYYLCDNRTNISVSLLKLTHHMHHYIRVC